MFSVEDFLNKIIRRLSMRSAFDIRDVSDHDLTGLHSIVNAGEQTISNTNASAIRPSSSSDVWRKCSRLN